MRKMKAESLPDLVTIVISPLLPQPDVNVVENTMVLQRPKEAAVPKVRLHVLELSPAIDGTVGVDLLDQAVPPSPHFVSSNKID